MHTRSERTREKCWQRTTRLKWKSATALFFFFSFLFLSFSFFSFLFLFFAPWAEILHVYLVGTSCYLIMVYPVDSVPNHNSKTNPSIHHNVWGYMKYLLCIACTNCCSASDNISVATVPVLTNVHTLWETACLVSFHLGILPFIAPLSLSNSLEGEVLTKKGWKENGLIIRWQNNRNNFDKPMKVYLTSSVI